MVGGASFLYQVYEGYVQGSGSVIACQLQGIIPSEVMPRLPLHYNSGYKSLVSKRIEWGLS